MHLEAWDRRFIRGDTDIPAQYYERPEIDDTTRYYLMAWNDLATERPVIATMASVSFGTIPRSKIKAYAEDDLGLVGEEVDLFISILRRVEAKSSAKTAADPTMTEQVPAGDTAGIKGIVKRVAKSGTPYNKSFLGKKPRVRHPRP